MPLLANLLNVNVKAPDVVFYQYSVHITSEDQRATEGKKNGSKLVDRLYGTYSSELRRTKFAYHDEEKALCTVGLPQNKLEFTIVLEETFATRDGVSESQFNPLLNIELDQIIKAYQHLGEADLTEFTMIVAKNNHQTKFFQTNFPDQVPPGTVIDTVISLPWNYDFYMCAQASMNGNLMPANCNVLLDEIGFSPDELQNLILSLSSMQHRRTTPISTETPICNSHLTAPQMEQIMKFEDLAKTLLGKSSIISCSMLEKLTLFSALVVSAAGAILEFTGGIYSYYAISPPLGLMPLLLLTPPHHKKIRVFLLLVVAASVGANFGAFFHFFVNKIARGITRTPALDFTIALAYTCFSIWNLCVEAYNMVAKHREDLVCALGEFSTSFMSQFIIGLFILDCIISPRVSVLQWASSCFIQVGGGLIVEL